MVAPAPPSAQLSYAERAKRAQNIKSAIAAPPPKNIVPAVNAVVDTTAATLAAPVTKVPTTLAVASMDPSPAVISSPLSTSANDTLNSSMVILARASSPLPISPHSAHNSSADTRNEKAEAGVSKALSSGQLAAKALSIVAAHTSNAGSSKPTTPNVWSQRIERMSAARATAVVSSPNQSATTNQNATPAVLSAPGATPALALGPSPHLFPSTSPEAHSNDHRVSNAQPKPNHILPEGDPFVVKSLPQRLVHAWAAATPSQPVPPPAASSSVVISITASTSSLEAPLSVTTMSSEAWPEVGKSVSAASTSTGADSLKVITAEEGREGEKKSEAGSENKGDKVKKGKAKSKWVQIPPAELQAAVDAATDAARKNHHSQGSRKGNKSSNVTSISNTNAHNSNGSNTNALNTPRSHSGRTSAVQSRIQSAQSSPRTQRGRRLPLEDGPAGMTLDTAGPPSHTPVRGPSPSQLPAPQQERHTPSPYHPLPQAPYPQHTRHNAGQLAAAQIPVIGSSPTPTAPGAPPLYPTADQAYTAQQHRHRSHPMQPAVPPVPAPAPSPHAFQVTAPPFYPQAHHLQPSSNSTSPPPAQIYQGVNRPPMYPPPAGTYGPPMYPMYPSPTFGYGGWQPQPVYGTILPHHQQKYTPLHYGNGPSGTNVPPQLNTQDTDAGVAEASQPPIEVVSDAEKVSTNGPTATSPLREAMMFGSIDSSPVQKEGLSGNTSPTIRRSSRSGVKTNGDSTAKRSEGEGAENTVDQAEQVHTRDESSGPNGKKDKKAKAANGTSIENEKEGANVVASKHPEGVIPPVSPEITWKFGTATPARRQQSLPPTEDDAPSPAHQSADSVNVLKTSSTMPELSSIQSNHSIQPNHADAVYPGVVDARSSVSFTHLPTPLPLRSLLPVGSVSPREHGIGFGDTLVPSLPSGGTDSDLDVKDYGYGFGDASGSGYATALAREERLAREREFEAERVKEREMAAWREESQKALTAATVAAGIAPTGFVGAAALEEGNVDENVVVPEVNSSHGGYVVNKEHVSWRGGGDGGRGNRRGGGTFGAGASGRGFGGSDRGGGYGGRRGRGANGYSRGYGRGGYGRGGGAPAGVSHRPPPFTATPPQHMHPLSPMNELHQPMGASHYPPPPHQIGAPYLAMPMHPNGFDAYGLPPSLPPVNGTVSVPQLSPPVPFPLSPISFPLDPTRYFLLGQLEYYLSPQNMASDFYLRQRMDARGWIPISLIASFNRVKTLTLDAQFVKDVLTLSSLVEVRGSMVRMGGWERFVLPDAAPSSVEDQPLPHLYQSLGTYQDERPPQQQQSTYEQQEQNTENQPTHPQDQQHYLPDEKLGSSHWQAGGIQSPHGHNGHMTKSADPSHLEDEEDEEDEEEDVVFVMGHEAVTWSPERGS